MKIIQILAREWTGRNGEKIVEVMGLGDDSVLYQWNKFEAKWEPNVIKTAKTVGENPF